VPGNRLADLVIPDQHSIETQQTPQNADLDESLDEMHLPKVDEDYPGHPNSASARE